MRIISVGWSPDYSRAAAIGLIVLVSSIILIYLSRHLISESSQCVTVTGKGYRPTVDRLEPCPIPSIYSVYASVLFHCGYALGYSGIHVVPPIP